MANIAIALANNDVAQIVWRYDAKIAGCLGFAVQRQATGGAWEFLPAWVGFVGQTNPAWTQKTTDVWPIQKFEWRDLTAQRGQTYTYRVIPASGDPTAEAPLTLDMANALVTNQVTLTEVRGSYKTYFNRGILSTQSLVHELPQGSAGTPNSGSLLAAITKIGDPIRQALAGQLIEGVELLLNRAATDGGDCYLALYELNDPELIASLLKSKNVHIILTNSDTDTEDKAGDPTGREQLHQAGVDITDRTVPSGHIGHNKFCVYVDGTGAANAVMTGSTNWTYTGLCAQSNNAIVVEDANLAKCYLDYWNRLKADTENNDSKQGPDFRTSNMSAAAAEGIDGGTTTLWFSPNTPKQRASKPNEDEATPPDLQQVFGLMEQAKHAILFLEFNPGTPSVITKAAECLNANPGLFVRGAVTVQTAAGSFETTLTHRGNDDTEVVAASRIEDQFAYWQKELLKSSNDAHAIVHSKIVVIDPMSPSCVVVTGSHNQGYRASYNNDENLLIISGQPDVAKAYVVNIMDVYDHYRFRAIANQDQKTAFSGLIANDTWQDRYFDPSDPTAKDNSLWFPPAGA
jgi:phosphatidylserine/phosphatidylglycerophosphate/cardiolipin synthase-like enzyme